MPLDFIWSTAGCRKEPNPRKGIETTSVAMADIGGSMLRRKEPNPRKGIETLIMIKLVADHCRKEPNPRKGIETELLDETTRCPLLVGKNLILERGLKRICYD